MYPHSLFPDLCNVLKRQIEKFPNGGYWVKNMPWYVTGDLKVINVSKIYYISFGLKVW